MVLTKLISAAQAMPSEMVNTDDKEWKRRCERRHMCLERVKTMFGGDRAILPDLPDPDDRTLSKREWEKALMTFRCQLRATLSELN